MNHIYRNIWNASTGTWTAVSETATARGKRSGSVKLAAVGAAVLAATVSMPGQTQPAPSVVVNAGNTRAYVAPNGVTVVNIATPNGAGLSHNRFTSFNVNPSGLVLNNGNSDAVARQSQLAGQVTANMNLNAQAGVILNEVVSNNRSTLAGFTEVLGGKADVILANPYGITCTGCGFINTDRVVLTTGNPYLAAGGALGGFNVGQGDILITGSGLNATAQQVLDLVTRSLRLEAPVNALDLKVVAGTNQWDYASRGITGVASATGAAPTYSIDTSVLGGMYANRIRLMATEAGVGVRMAGDAAASAEDFMLTAAGKVELQGRISAARDVSLATTAADATALVLADAGLTATGKLSLAAAGGAVLSGSALVAGTDLAVTAGSLLDTASASARADTNLRHAGATLSLTVSEGASLGATQWSATGNLSGRFGNLSTTAATRLYSSGGTLIASADRGDLALGLAVLQSAGDLSLTSAGRIATAVGGAVKSSSGTLALSGRAISNAGTLTADQGEVVLRVDETLANSGQIHAAGDVDIGARSEGAGTGTGFDNSGTVLAGKAIALQADTVRNAAGGTVQAREGSVIDAGSMNNAGQWLLSQQAGAADLFAIRGELANTGTLQGAGSIGVAAGSVSNGGVWLAATDLAVAATGGFGNSGTVQAGTTLAIAADGRLANTATGVLKAETLNLSAAHDLENAGVVTADKGHATLRIGGLLGNSGVLQASGNIDIADREGAATQAVINSGKLLAGQAMVLKAASFTGTASSWTQASTGTSVSGGSLDNAGVWLLSQQAGARDTLELTGALLNSGTVQTAGSAMVAAGSVSNSGAILAADTLGASTTAGFANASGGTVQVGNALSITSGGQIANAADGVLRAATVAVSAGGGLTNAGTVTAESGSATVRVDGAIVNSGTVHAAANIDLADRRGNGTQALTNSGVLLADRALEIRAAAIINAGGARVQAGTASHIAAASLDNQATWLLSTQTGAADQLALTGQLVNTGMLQSAGSATITAGGAANAGVLLAVADLGVGTSGTLDNTGTMQAGQTLTLRSDAAVGNGARGILKANALSVAAGQGFANAGLARADLGAATLRVSGTLTNTGELSAAQSIDVADFSNAATQTVVNSGKLIAGQSLAMKAASVDNRASGFIQAATGSGVAAGSLANAGSWLLSQQASALDQVTTSGAMVNSGTLQSAGSQALSAATLTNQGQLLATGNLGIATSGAFSNESKAVVQSGQTLSVDAGGDVANGSGGVLKAQGLQIKSGGTGLTNVGTMTADAGDATLRVSGTLTNSGQIHARQTLDMADRTGGATMNLVNGGLLLADGGLALKVAALTNQVAGRIQAGTGSQVTATRLDNAGVWLLSQLGTAADAVNVTETLSNSGTLQSAGNETLTARQIDNAGKLLAGGSLAVNVTTSLGNGGSGTVQAGQLLSVSGTGAALTNAGGGKLLGNGLAIDVASLDNAGSVQGGSRTDSTVMVAGTLTNRASGLLNMASSATGAGTVAAQTIVNAGTLQSAGALVVKVGTGGLTNGGKAIAEGDLTVQARSTGGNFTAGVEGLLQSRGGTLSVLGGNATVLNVGGAGTVVGEDLVATLGTVNLANGATLSSGDAMTLTLGSLTLAGADAAVLGGTGGTGTTRITTTGALANNGLLFSGNDLSVASSTLTNSKSGGIAALHDLTVRASSGNLTNQGLLYAGNALAAYAESGTLTNVATLTEYQGSINAGKSIYLKAATLINNSTIDSDGSITIDATSLRNEVLGGDTRAYGAETAHSAATQTNHWTDYDFPDDHEYWSYSSTWSKSQSYTGGTPQMKPQINGKDTVSLTFNTAKNLGGVISGATVNLTGTGVGATFVNDSLALQKTTYTQTWTEHTKYIALGPETYYKRQRESEATTNAVTEISTIGAGIYATTLNGTGFALTNNGSTAAVSAIKAGPAKGTNVKTQGGDAVSGGTLSSAEGTSSGAGSSTFGGASGVDGKSATAATAASGASGAVGTSFAGVRTLNGQTAISFIGVNAANGVQGTAFGGINIPVPTNPNGLYVVARAPDARYLVESNPRYQIGAASVGSEYLSNLLGYDADTLIRRLGDASYEAYLIKQQLVAQTGNSLLVGYQSAGAQVQKLMEQAATESKSMGLTYGQALTPAQQAELKQDIVWMVQTEINGQVVLAPVVYLSAQTRASLTQGAVIAADSTSLNVTSLTNTGGTIAGGTSLNVVSVGDVTNTSGTITGGNVAVSSTSGSIVNQTASSGSGNALRYVTEVGKTAAITATGSLSLDAAQDITNKGATVAAGGDASLKAGGSVTFDTLEKKTTDTTRGAYAQEGGTGTTTTTTNSVEQVKSGLTAGGNLAVTAGKDITLAGTDTRAGGNADLNAGGNLNILARENSTTTHTESQASGVGMGGSLYGSSQTTTDSLSVRNVGSTLEVGGNANLSAKNDVTVQGSSVDVAGKGSINATSVNVLAGRNYDESTTNTTSTSILRVTNEGTRNTGDSSATAGASTTRSGASAGAGAATSTGSTSSGGLQLASTSSTSSTSTDLKNVASTVNFGGDLSVTASKDVTLVGSTVGAANTTVNAQNINVVAARDVATSSTTTTTTSVGLMGSSDNKAGAGAEAKAGASGNVVASAAANAKAEASASTDNRVDLMQTSRTSTETLDVVNQGSAITSRGDTTLKATNALNVQGSTVAAGNDVTVSAKDMRFTAATDVHETRTTGNTTAVGLYATGEASATAAANASAGTNNSVDASAKVSAGVGVGLYGSNNQSRSVEGSTTAVVSGIQAGGNINRTATNAITDVGTAMEAGGNLNQSANTITSLAASNTNYASSSSDTNTVKIGAYAEAEAGAKANASLTSKAEAKTESSAGAGVRASYQNEQEGQTSASSSAVVSTVKVGGNVTSTSTGATTLEGTSITAGKDVTLSAGSLDYRAARDTASASETTTSAGGSVGVDIANRSVSLAGSYENEKASERSSTAVVGGVQAGGNLKVTTTGDTRLEGTNLAAGGAASVSAGGNLAFDAAANTSETSGQAVNASAGVTVGKKGGSSSKSVEAEGGYSQSKSTASEAVTGSISSGGALTLQAGGDATFTGTGLASGGDAAVAAGGNLTFGAARSTTSSQEFGVSASVGASSEKSKSGATESGREMGVSGNYGQSNSDTAQGATVASGGNLSLSSGKDTTLEGARVKAADAVGVSAGGSVRLNDATSTSTSVAVGVGLNGSSSTQTKAPAAAGSGKGGTAGTGGDAGASGKPEREGSGALDLNVDLHRSSQATTLSGQSVTIQPGAPKAVAAP